MEASFKGMEARLPLLRVHTRDGQGKDGRWLRGSLPGTRKEVGSERRRHFTLEKPGRVTRVFGVSQRRGKKVRTLPFRFVERKTVSRRYPPGLMKTRTTEGEERVLWSRRITGSFF